MKIYVLHYKPLIQRRIFIEKMMKKMKLNFEFITDFDREEIKEYLNQYQLNKTKWNKQVRKIKPIYFLHNKGSHSLKILLKKFLYEIITPKDLRPRQLTPAQISCTLKHIYALRKIQKLNSPALILEDDLIMKENTLELIEQAFELCTKSFDYVDLGGGCNLSPSEDELCNSNYKNFALLSTPRSRTSAGYMISPKAAAILADEMTPFVMPTGWQFNYLFQKYNFKVAWSHPPAFIHGSQSNYYKSSIQGI